MQSYQQLEKIGWGSSGKIYRLRNIFTGKADALKKVQLGSLSATQLKEAEQEIHILRNLHHPNIIRYKDSFVSKDNLCIVTEFCECGDLSKLIKAAPGPLPEDDVLRIFIQVLLGVEYLHKKQILHRDLKAMNIFLKRGLKVKIGDLGIARHLNESFFASTVVGTPFYLSPELCQERPYNYKSDIWALGCLLYELCAREPPFKASERQTLRERILDGHVPDIPGVYSRELNKIVHLILRQDPRDRPSVEEILGFPFIRAKMDQLGITPNNFTLKIKNSKPPQHGRDLNPGKSKKPLSPFWHPQADKSVVRERVQRASQQLGSHLTPQDQWLRRLPLRPDDHPRTAHLPEIASHNSRSPPLEIRIPSPCRINPFPEPLHIQKRAWELHQPPAPAVHSQARLSSGLLQSPPPLQIEFSEEQRSLRKNVGENIRQKPFRNKNPKPGPKSLKDEHLRVSEPPSSEERLLRKPYSSLPRSLHKFETLVSQSRSFCSEISLVENHPRAKKLNPVIIQARVPHPRPVKKSIIKVP